MKRFVCVLLCIFTVLTVAGCGKDPAPAPEAVPGEQTEAQTPEEAVAPEEEAAPEKQPSLTASDFIFDPIGDNECVIIGCLTEAEILEVPEKLQEYTVVEIGPDAFSNSEVIEVRLPDTVKYIRDYAFTNCSELKEVYLGNSLEEIGSTVFNFCPKLETVTFPDSLRKIGILCFGMCTSIREVYIPAGATEISDVIADIAFCPNIVIVTPKGSVAEAVALETGLPVKNT